jgi:hypothetical protein
MSTHDLCDRYLTALNTADLDLVLSLFDPAAVVVSRLYGTRPIHDFFTTLFADTGRSETTPVNIFESITDTPAIVLQFKYRWTLKNGTVVSFDCADVFDLAPDRSHFTRLTILYDTHPLRADFEASRSG